MLAEIVANVVGIVVVVVFVVMWRREYATMIDKRHAAEDAELIARANETERRRKIISLHRD